MAALSGDKTTSALEIRAASARSEVLPQRFVQWALEICMILLQSSCSLGEVLPTKTV